MVVTVKVNAIGKRRFVFSNFPFRFFPPFFVAGRLESASRPRGLIFSSHILYREAAAWYDTQERYLGLREVAWYPDDIPGGESIIGHVERHSDTVSQAAR